MHDKGLLILIQRSFRKFSLIDKFNPTSGEQGLYNGIESLSRLFSTKLKICIAKSQEKHP